MRNHEKRRDQLRPYLRLPLERHGTQRTGEESGLNRQITGVFLLMFLLLPQFGCSTADVVSSHVLKQFLKDDPTIVQATVTAAGDVNPDARGRPSPIKVRFYLLKSPKVFQNTDFFTLKEQGRELLVDDLRLYDEKVFKPGAVTMVELMLPPEETLEDERLFLGIVAGYWNLDQATWQLVYEIEVHDTTEAVIALDRAAVSLKSVE
jgi:type VI secretion system protein VasD